MHTRKYPAMKIVPSEDQLHIQLYPFPSTSSAKAGDDIFVKRDCAQLRDKARVPNAKS